MPIFRQSNVYLKNLGQIHLCPGVWSGHPDFHWLVTTPTSPATIRVGQRQTKDNPWKPVIPPPVDSSPLAKVCFIFELCPLQMHSFVPLFTKLSDLTFKKKSLFSITFPTICKHIYISYLHSSSVIYILKTMLDCLK